MILSAHDFLLVNVRMYSLMSTGVINYVLPYTVGSGTLVLQPILQNVSKISPRLIICSIFGKMFTFGVSNSIGKLYF